MGERTDRIQQQVPTTQNYQVDISDQYGDTLEIDFQTTGTRTVTKSVWHCWVDMLVYVSSITRIIMSIHNSLYFRTDQLVDIQQVLQVLHLIKIMVQFLNFKINFEFYSLSSIIISLESDSSITISLDSEALFLSSVVSLDFVFSYQGLFRQIFSPIFPLRRLE